MIISSDDENLDEYKNFDDLSLMNEKVKLVDEIDKKHYPIVFKYFELAY